MRQSCLRRKGKITVLLEEAMEREDSKFRRMCERFWRYYDDWWVFLEVDHAAPTNNEAERSLRALVILRKKTFGTKSLWGSAFVARMYSVIMTLRKRKQNVLDTLSTILRNAWSGKEYQLRVVAASF
jgi:transposase